MICPACKTNNNNHPPAECCIQCGSDIQLHRLLKGVREEMQMKMETIKPGPDRPTRRSALPTIIQTTTLVLLLLCIVLVLFVGMRILLYLDRAESTRTTVSDKWSDASFQQLQQMNAIIQKELNLIIDQRQENLTLREKIQTLTAALTPPNQINSGTLKPNPQQLPLGAKE